MNWSRTALVVLALGVASCGPCSEATAPPDAAPTQPTRDAATSSDAAPPIEEVRAAPPGSPIGTFIRGVRLSGGTGMGSPLPGVPEGPLLLVVTGPPGPGLPIDYEGDGVSIRCYAGRSRLRPTIGGGPNRLVLIGADPGGDLANTPLWCQHVSYGAPEDFEAALASVMKADRRSVQWLRGPDGKNRELPIVPIGEPRAGELPGAALLRAVQREVERQP